MSQNNRILGKASNSVLSNTQQPVKNLKELEAIDLAMLSLCGEIQKYLDDSKNLWDNVFVPFIDTRDCMTLQKLSKNDYRVFLNFMSTQKVYRIMMISKARLERRKKYLLSL